jgi:hypothetical protein
MADLSPTEMASSPSTSPQTKQAMTMTRTSPQTHLLTPSKISPSTPSITLTPTKQPAPPPRITHQRAEPKRQSGFAHIRKLFSILPERHHNALLRDYVPGEEPEGLVEYEDGVEKFVDEERWNIRSARARLTGLALGGHRYSRSVIPTIRVEEMGPPNLITRFWEREKRDVGSGSLDMKTHSRYHSM